jgi:hypothetical protein
MKSQKFQKKAQKNLPLLQNNRPLKKKVNRISGTQMKQARRNQSLKKNLGKIRVNKTNFQKKRITGLISLRKKNNQSLNSLRVTMSKKKWCK